MAPINNSVRVGAAAFVLGLSLAGPQAVGVASADGRDSDSSTVSAGPAATDAGVGSAPGRRHSNRAPRSTSVAGSTRSDADSDAGTANPNRHSAVKPAATARTVATPAVVADGDAVAPSSHRTLQAPLSSAARADIGVPRQVVNGSRQSGMPPSTAVLPASALAPAAQCATCRALMPAQPAPAPAAAIAPVGAKIDELFARVSAFLASLPANRITDLLSGTLLLVRRTLFNNAPTASPVQLAQTADDTITGTIGAVDPEGDPIVYKLLSQPSNGTVSIDPATGEYTYTPTSFDAYGGTDQFTVGLGDTGPHLHLFRTAAPDASVAVNIAPSSSLLTFPELDSKTSALAVRVDSSQPTADGIRVEAGTTFTLTLPGPSSSYTWLANKSLVDITPGLTDNTLTVKANQPGFLGVSVQAKDGTAGRYLGVYIANPTTHVVPDISTVDGKTPVGTVALTNGTGDAFLESFNFQDKVAPIDYLYIYDQGGADFTDGNLTGLLTQAVRHGMVPAVVFYNIQAVSNASGSTGVVEGPDSAYKAINEHNLDWGQTPGQFTGYMTRYFTKVAKDFTTMNQVGVPVQVVMEPDFLGYMAINAPSFQVQLPNRNAFPQTGTAGYLYIAADTAKMYQWDGTTYNPDTTTPKPLNTDRTQNYANVMKPMTDAGLLTAADPQFDNTVEGMVEAINYYVGKNMPNLRIGWKTNIWSVASSDYQNGKMGLLHETDSVVYPWQNQWSSGVGWTAGRPKISTAGTNLGNFLNKVGVTSWAGSPDRKPFLAIDKYGVDGAYPYDPNWQTSGTAALGDMTDLITTAQWYCNNGSQGCDDATINKYFGVDVATLKSLKTDQSDAQFQQVFANFQDAAKADPNIARWFFNADQWNNYLLLVKALSTAVNAPVMLWQIPQGHINGSTTLTGRDLPNTSAADCPSGSICGFEDSATSYFFGDSFTATDGMFDHLSANNATDPKITGSGSTVTWGEHMTDAANAGAMSVLFGAGLGISTRGTPTPGGDITDLNFWADKAAGYLSVP